MKYRKITGLLLVIIKVMEELIKNKKQKITCKCMLQVKREKDYVRIRIELADKRGAVPRTNDRPTCNKIKVANGLSVNFTNGVIPNIQPYALIWFVLA